MYNDQSAGNDVGTVERPTHYPADVSITDRSTLGDTDSPAAVNPSQDYYEPPVDSHVGALERRMLYLVHQLTFRQYFCARPYSTILAEHLARMDRTPASIEFPLGIDETKARLAALLEAIQQAGWQNMTLQALCESDIDSTSVVWVASQKVDEAGIFLPFYHAADKPDVQALFTQGFVDDELGWGAYKVHALFSTRALDYVVPGHAIRRATVRKAKHLSVIRPRVTMFEGEENSITMAKGNSRCCSGSTSCTWSGNDELYCSTTEAGDCSLMSDACS